MIIYLNCKDNPITFNKKNYLLRAAKRMGINSLKLTFKDIEEMQNQDLAGHVLNIEPCDFKYGTKWTGFWHIDNLGIGDAKYYASYPLFDTVFTADLSKDPKATLLLQAADPQVHRRIPEIAQDFDFVMSCSLGHIDSAIYKGRQKAYELLKQEFSWIDLGKDHKPYEYVRGLNKAKVQFVHSMVIDGRGEIAQRFFECLAIGPVITNWVQELEYTGLIEGQDYFSYKSEGEMMHKMRLLVSDEGIRKTMAHSGRTAALLYHSYENRLGSIFNIASQYA